MAHRFTIGVEEEFQIVDPETWELRSHVSAAAVGRGFARLRRSDQARDAPVDRRDRHEDLRKRERTAAGDPSAPAANWSPRPRARGLHVAAAGTHPFSSWIDQVISPGERYENIVEELQQLARSLLIFGLHVHVADARQADHDRPDERGALLPAAPARALDQLAVLDGPRHRAEVVPHDRLPPLSAHRHSRSLRIVERLRELRQPAGRAALHRQRQEDLVGRAAAPDLRHAGVPHVRRADAAWKKPSPSPRSPRRSS